MAEPTNKTPDIRYVDGSATPAPMKSLYSNNVSVSLSGVDARIVFSELIDQSQSQLVAEVRANIVMSIAHAKAVAFVLNKSLESWDKSQAESKGQTLAHVTTLPNS
jgi:hypothetical protein